MTDLDGTAVHELEGRLVLSATVEAGLEAVHAAGRKVLVNTLRFPLSVIQAFGAQWHRRTRAPIPLVSLSGSLVGVLHPSDCGCFQFEEFGAVVLEAEDIRRLVGRIGRLVDTGADDLMVFFYPRDWHQGELIWTPRNDRTIGIAAKYASASHVFSSTPAELERVLLTQPICMVFVLIDAPADRLMAYQHTEKASFVVRAGVDKRSGALALARHLGVSLADSIGAGDATPDTFLTAVGLALVVGNPDLPYRGLTATVHLDDPIAFGNVLLQAAAALK